MLSLSLCLAFLPLTTTGEPAREALRTRWTEAMRATQVPGLAAVGIEHGKVAFIECLGVRRPDRPEEVDPDTYFYIASMTKTYVATVTQILAAQGKLAIEDPVVTREPRFALADPEASASITIEDLLCHRPGLDFGPLVFRDAYTGQIDDAIYFELLAFTRPGGAPAYSNVHFTLLGRALESVAADGVYGQWRDVMKRELCDPLGMSRTTGYASLAWSDPNAAFPTEGTTAGSVVIPHKSDRTMHAAGGICTTANDLAKYLLFHLGDGALDGRRLMPPAAAAAMRARRTAVDAQRFTSFFAVSGFGLGWQIGDYRGETLCGHGGGYAGASAYFAFLPERGIAAAVVLNRSSTSTMALAFCDVMDTLLGHDLDASLLDAARRAGANADWSTPPIELENPAAEAGALSLAPEEYVGSYADDRHGVLEVSLADGKLSLALGDLACDLGTTGKDAFRAQRGPIESYTGYFELTDDGTRVEYVVFHRGDGEPAIWFERRR